MPYSYYYWGFDPTYLLILIGAVICMIASARVKTTFNKYAQYRSMSGLLILIGAVICMIASARVKTTFNKYAQYRSMSGMTGAQAAEQILRAAGIYDVTVQHIAGNLTDHYHPGKKTLNLSDSVYNSTSVAAIGVAAHECGHAIVTVQHIAGNLTDHYHPGKKTLNLSDSVYNSTSVAAIGVAAHECGHAIQHQQGYFPLNLRTAIVPVANIGSSLAWPLILIGLLFSRSTGSLLIQIGILCFSFALNLRTAIVPVANIGSSLAWPLILIGLLFSRSTGSLLIQIGILCFSFAVLFQLVTLPVEFNASSRALAMLGKQGILSESELPYTKKVLGAAALTYVAGAAASLLQLLRLVLLFGGRRNDD